MAPGASAHAPAASFVPEGLFLDLLEVSLTAVNLLRPVYGPDGADIVDFTLDYLNPAAQRMSQLPERPGGTLLAHRPSTAETGILDYYRRVFDTGAAEVFEVNYQAEGLDNYFRLAARRSGEWLVVSFTDTGDQPRTPVEVALRAAQAAEHAARADAEAQRQRFYEVLQQLPAYVAVYRGPDHVYQFVNPPYQSLFPGRSFAGRPFRDGMPEAEGLGVVALCDRVYQTGEPFCAREMEGWFDFTGTGEPEQVFLDLTLHPLRDAQGRIDGVLDYSHNVTEQVRARRQVEQLNQELEARVDERAQEALALQAAALAAAQRHVREREEFYQVFEQAPVIVALLRGPEHFFHYRNPAFQGLFPGRALTGHLYADVMPEIVAAGLMAELDRVYATGQPYYGTALPVVAVPPDGSAAHQRYYDFSYQPYREHGHIVGISIFAYDVTEQVLARQEREAQQRRLYAAFEQAPIGIAIQAGPDLVYEFVNPAYQRMVPGRQLPGRRFFDVFAEMKGTAVETLLRHVYDTGETQQEQELLIPVARADGSPELDDRYFTIVYQARRDDDGRVNGILAFVMEVTAPVEARQAVERGALALAAANQQLTRTNVDLDNFIYTASHDLKAPITNIEGLLDTLRHELPDPAPTGEVEYVLGLMQDSVERFKRTIDHLTDVSKLQKEHDPPTVQVLLAPVLEDVRQDLVPLLLQTDGHLHLRVQECPPLRFSEKNLRSVLYNLLSNALKYRHPDRRPEVHVRCRPEGAFIVLEVQDNGLGLDLARETQLFAMFQRLHTHVEGSGLGLYMVKRIMENAGGKITVHSQVGEGTTFAVYFPH